MAGGNILGDGWRGKQDLTAACLQLWRVEMETPQVPTELAVRCKDSGSERSKETYWDH